MHRIILDGKEVESLVPDSLPMLIHGAEGSGASMYTISIAAKWLSQSYKILFLCGYTMAEEAFAKEVSLPHPYTHFFTKEKVGDFIDALKTELDDKTVVIIKNIELFGNDVLSLANKNHSLIISGDVTQSPLKDELLKKKFTTEVYFSPLEGKDVPPIEKYHGYVVSSDYKGITSLQ